MIKGSYWVKKLEIPERTEKGKISETWKATPTEIVVHAFGINPYLHEFFEPIPIN